MKTTTVWNDNKEAFSPWAFVIHVVSLSQFQLSADDFKFEYPWGGNNSI